VQDTKGAPNLCYWVKGGDSAFWNFKATAPGRYQVSALYSTPGGGNNYAVVVAGQKLVAPVQVTGGWDNPREFPVGEVKITKSGIVPVVVGVEGTLQGALFNLYAVRLTPVGLTPVRGLSQNSAETAPSVVAQHGQLAVRGNRIVDKDGKPVVLRGMSFFWSQWMGKYYTRETVKWLRDDWRCTIVRAAMGVEAGGYLQNPQQEKQKVITLVDAAIEQGIYVIIDWHDHKAHQHTAQAQAFFAEMAQRYGEYPNVIYEIFNEPLNDASWAKDIKPYSEAVIRTIREHDADNLIVCGSRNWSQQVDEASKDPLPFTNIAYSLHFYAATHKESLRETARKALNNGVALMVTEFGLSEASGNGKLDYEETQRWWKFLDENGISWCNWSVADKEEASAALKPGASATGGWADDVITPSGLFVRDELQRKSAQP
jgi:endoglucanase